MRLRLWYCCSLFACHYRRFYQKSQDLQESLALKTVRQIRQIARTGAQPGQTTDYISIEDVEHWSLGELPYMPLPLGGISPPSLSPRRENQRSDLLYFWRRCMATMILTIKPTLSLLFCYLLASLNMACFALDLPEWPSTCLHISCCNPILAGEHASISFCSPEINRPLGNFSPCDLNIHIYTYTEIFDNFLIPIECFHI